MAMPRPVCAVAAVSGPASAASRTPVVHANLRAAVLPRARAHVPQARVCSLTTRATAEDAEPAAPTVAAPSIEDTPMVGIIERSELTAFPAEAGVYAVYDGEGALQYVGLSRKISLSVGNHMEELPELTKSIRYWVSEDTSRSALTEAWKAWVGQAVAATGTVPPGNMPGEKKWQTRKRAPPKPELKLTPGKGVEDLTVSITELVDQLVKDCKIVAFVKGTRTQPQCGFSYKTLTILNNLKVDYEVVNVLDEVYNPGLREAIKEYSMWPTIPQVYVDGEFIGGADIIEELAKTGELRELTGANI